MPPQILIALFAVSSALMGLTLADRERYIHEFRIFDLNFRSNMLLSKASKNKAISSAHRKIAKTWLKRSVEFRRNSIYITFSTVYMIFCTIFLMFAFGIDVFFNSFYFWPLLIIAVIFSIASFLNHLIRYGLIGFSPRFEVVSHRLSDFFPPLPPPLVLSHLSFKSWPEIYEVMDSEIKDFIRKAEHYSTLKRHKLVDF